MFAERCAHMILPLSCDRDAITSTVPRSTIQYQNCPSFGINGYMHRNAQLHRAWHVHLSSSPLPRAASPPIFVSMSMTGTVKKWIEDNGFGFITPEDGGDDVFIHRTQLADAEALEQGETVSFDKEYDDRKGKYKASNCTVTSSGGGGGGGWGGGGKGEERYEPYGGGKGW